MSVPTRPRKVLELLPGRRYLQRGLVAVAITSSLVFGSLYWVTAADGGWPTVLAWHVALALVIAVVTVGYLRCRITVDDGEIVVARGFHAPRRIPLDRVAGTRLVQVYRAATAETTPHLYVCDAAGRPMLRLHGEFWARADMERLAVAIGAPVTVASAPVTAAELHAASPLLLQWWQRPLRRPKAQRAIARG